MLLLALVGGGKGKGEAKSYMLFLVLMCRIAGRGGGGGGYLLFLVWMRKGVLHVMCVLLCCREKKRRGVWGAGNRTKNAPWFSLKYSIWRVGSGSGFV